MSWPTSFLIEVDTDQADHVARFIREMAPDGPVRDFGAELDREVAGARAQPSLYDMVGDLEIQR